MKLRPYQQECLEAIGEAFQGGCSRQLIAMATAAGKTLVASHIPHQPWYPHKQLWMLVHRDELVSQAYRQFVAANPTLKVGIEKARDKADLDCDVIIASVQSVGTTSGGFTKRIQRFDPEKVGVLVLDEAHHSTSEIWTNVLRYFRALKGCEREDLGKLVVGITATPQRTDGVGLEAVYDQIVFERGIRQLIDEGWLAKIEAFRIQTEASLNGVKMHHGDFAVGELESRVDNESRNQLIIDKYKELAEGKSAIAFVVSVAHAHNLASGFRRSGIPALPFSGQTPDHERERLLAAHESGEVKVICSCDAIREGTDLAWAEVGLMCRPTKSGLLYTQSIGRLTRLYPAPEVAAPVKTKALILDFVDNSSRHRLCTVPSLFGLRGEFDLKGQSVTEALEEIESAQEKFKQLSLDSFTDLESMRSLVESVDLLKPPVIPEVIRQHSELSWTEGPGGSFQIIGTTAHLSVRENQLGQFEVYRHAVGSRRLMKLSLSLAEAVKLAEGMLPSEERNLLRSSARWRTERPSDSQIKFLSRLDTKLYKRFQNLEQFTQFVLATYTKGDVSSLISERLNQKPQFTRR